MGASQWGSSPAKGFAPLRVALQDLYGEFVSAEGRGRDGLYWDAQRLEWWNELDNQGRALVPIAGQIAADLTTSGLLGFGVGLACSVVIAYVTRVFMKRVTELRGSSERAWPRLGADGAAS